MPKITHEEAKLSLYVMEHHFENTYSNDGVSSWTEFPVGTRFRDKKVINVELYISHTGYKVYRYTFEHYDDVAILETYIEQQENKDELLELYQKLCKSLDVTVENGSVCGYIIEKIEKLEEDLK